mgnify:CR=1 FL=1
MFGYIRVKKEELKIKDFEVYKAVYCSLCKKLGKSYGILSRLTLSYDFAFLSLLNISLKSGCVSFERKRCAFNPLKKCNYCKSSDELDMPSAAAMIMLYYKILDNIKDEKGLKKLGFLLLKPIFSGAHKKAAKKYPFIEETVAEYIEGQSLAESDDNCTLDSVCDPTAKALSKLLPLCSDDPSQKRVLERLGYCLGRYIYLMDAGCDIEKDIKSGSFNVLKKYVKEGNIKKDTVLKTEPQIYFCINEAAKAFELLEIKKFKPILGNIIYLGLEDVYLKELKNEKSL